MYVDFEVKGYPVTAALEMDAVPHMNDYVLWAFDDAPGCPPKGVYLVTAVCWTLNVSMRVRVMLRYAKDANAR